MAQQQIKGQSGDLGVSGSLDVYEVPGSATVEPLAASAVFDGTGAAGSFIPCLTFKTITGAIIARCPAPEVAAGDTAEVSWFPGVTPARSPVLADYWQGAYFAETFDRQLAEVTPVGIAVNPPGVGFVGIARQQPAGRTAHGLWLFLTQIPTGTRPTNMQLGLMNSLGTVVAVTGDIAHSLELAALGYQFYSFTAPYKFPVTGWYYVCWCSTGAWTGAGSRDPAAYGLVPGLAGPTSAAIFSPIDRMFQFSLPLGTLAPGDSVPLTGGTYGDEVPWYGIA